VALAAAGLYAVWRGGRRAGHAALAVCIVAVLWGIVRLQNAATHPLETAPTATVVIAQGSQRRDWDDPDAIPDYHTLAEATAEAVRRADAKADLVVWSESSVPGLLLEDPALKEVAARTAARLNAPLLTGTIGRTPEGRPANLAVLLKPSGAVAGTYQKRRLVPFGEWVPFRNVLPLLSDFGVVDVDEVPGNSWNVLTAGPLKLGVPICFESAVPGIARAFVKNGANLLVVITNDGWFGRTGMAEQHADMSPLRAVETGRWLVRCGTTGLSGFVSPRGVWTSRLPLDTAGSLLGGVGLRTDTTPYVRFGDWFLWLCAALVAALLAWRPKS
jgi:apolipoprotein N-acyltransferase